MPPTDADRPTLESIAALTAPELLERYRAGSDRFDRRVLELDQTLLDTCFRPEAGVGRWSCRILAGHVADADLMYTHRMRRAVAEDNPVLSVWDENAFIDAGLYAGEQGGADRPIAGSIAVVHTLRLWTADWLTTLGPEQFARPMLHPERGQMTVVDVLSVAVWHLEHHARFLSRKIDRLLGVG